jgi:signal peptidase II
MSRHRLFELWIVALVLILDQVTKAMVRAEFLLHQEREIIPGLLNLTRVHNTGAAFGMFNAADLPMKTVILGVVAAAALAGLAMYAAMLPPDQRLTRLGLSFIIGGAAGNLIDRIAAGYVLDFVDFYWGDWHFWAFNVADAAITAGVALMILDLLGVKGRRVPRTV